ncbi:MAG TPA: serine/threonine-protein kinase [Polyangiaceae bacterium]
MMAPSRAAQRITASNSADHLDSLLLRVTEELTTPREVPYEPPRFLGPARRFEVLEKIGAGAMGSVFSAYDAWLDRDVAIKLPQGGRTGVEQLQTEARALARMDHENIVRLWDVGGCDEVPFLVLERLEGQSLGERMSAGMLTTDAAMATVLAVLRALQHAHERGVIHRDIKPSNVFLTSEGTVKVLDFGLAHCESRSIQGSVLRAEDTVPGVNEATAAGSPAYMAPEQWQGAGQDARTDIWAVGILMYQLFLGGLPFDADTLQGLRDQICSACVTPRWRPPDARVSGRLMAVMDVCLAKQPEARFGSARELSNLLEQIVSVGSAGRR